MGTKHRHYDVIVAWAAGEEIELKDNGVWIGFADWFTNPSNVIFFENKEYRIKPKLVKKEAEVVVYKTSEGEIKAHVSFLGPTLQIYNATLIKTIQIEWEEEE